jgi:hypothetical protein
MQTVIFCRCKRYLQRSTVREIKRKEGLRRGAEGQSGILARIVWDSLELRAAEEAEPMQGPG